MKRKHTISAAAVLFLLVGLAVPGTSSHIFQDPPAQEAIVHSNIADAFDHPVFSEDWDVFAGTSLGERFSATDTSDGLSAATPPTDVPPGPPSFAAGGEEDTSDMPSLWDGPDTPSDGTDTVGGGDQPDTSPGDSDVEDSPSTDVTEERDVTPAPEPDGQGEDWISYPNPRDHILDYETLDSMGDMKVCKVLLNQDGEVIDGDTVDATFSVDTNINEHESAYDDADPVTFSTPLDHVADMVGSDPSLPEGDGMLDAECAEYHNLPFGDYTYSMEEISGPDADEVEFVGVTEYWDDANRGNPFGSELYQYGENSLSDGQVTLAPDEDNNHAEVVFVNQLT